MRPTFQWAATFGATAYELDIGDACPTEGFAKCSLALPRLAIREITTTSFRPSVPLVVDTHRPVGRRYFWRVRACNDHGCSPWSAVRYVNIGRQAADLDGDGYADLLVSAPGSGRALLYLGGPHPGGAPTLSLGLELEGQFMFQAAWAGDVNADGYGDVIVGGSPVPLLNGDFRKPMLRFGHAPGDVRPDLVFDADGPSAELGFPMAGAGDMDADGFADVALGWGHPAPGGGPDKSRGVDVYRGRGGHG